MEQLDLQLLLGIDDAAKLLNVSKDWLYRNHRKLPFCFKMGKQLQFSVPGIFKFVESKIEEKQNGTIPNAG